MTSYVAGLLFNPSLSWVALIRKEKPAWQRGKLNAIGGKIEESETPDQAMVREFREETSLEVDDWRPFCELRGADWCVHFFTATGDLSQLQEHSVIQTDEGAVTERIVRLPVHSIVYHNTLPNLRWLVPMALDKDEVHAVVEDL